MITWVRRKLLTMSDRISVSFFEIDSAKLAAMCEHALNEIKRRRELNGKRYVERTKNGLNNSWWNRVFKIEYSDEAALSDIQNNWVTSFDYHMQTKFRWKSHQKIANKLIKSAKYTKTISVSVDDFNKIERFNDPN